MLDAIAKRVIYTGGIGTGSIAKIMHNSASFTLDLVMAECWTDRDASIFLTLREERAQVKVRFPPVRVTQSDHRQAAMAGRTTVA